MMKVYRIALVLSLCCAISNYFSPFYAIAEQGDNEFFFSTIAYQLQKWRETIAGIEYDIGENNQEHILGLTNHFLDISLDLVSMQMTGKSTVQDNIGNMLYQHSTASFEDETYYCLTEPWWIEDMQIYARLSGMMRQDYIKVNISYYNMDGNHIAREGMEIGVRDDAIRCLIIDFDPEEYSTGRYAFEAKNGKVDVIYTRTFGEVFQTVLDIDQWVKGYDSIWNKELLLPAN